MMNYSLVGLDQAQEREKERESEREMTNLT